MMTNKINCIMDYLDEILPNAKCELNYTKDYELVIAVMLSAQTTDKSVNRVTGVLFSKYPSLESLSCAELSDVEQIIKSIGLYERKALNVVQICKKIISDFGGVVPQDKELLKTLPGVGNKTANVIRAELFKIPEIPVDTHVDRVSKRLGLAKPSDDVGKVEIKLRKVFPIERYILTHHQFIHFGRYYCTAIRPKCESCKLQNICIYFKNKSTHSR